MSFLFPCSNRNFNNRWPCTLFFPPKLVSITISHNVHFGNYLFDSKCLSDLFTLTAVKSDEYNLVRAIDWIELCRNICCEFDSSISDIFNQYREIPSLPRIEQFNWKALHSTKQNSRIYLQKRDCLLMLRRQMELWIKLILLIRNTPNTKFFQCWWMMKGRGKFVKKKKEVKKDTIKWKLDRHILN